MGHFICHRHRPNKTRGPQQKKDTKVNLGTLSRRISNQRNKEMKKITGGKTKRKKADEGDEDYNTNNTNTNTNTNTNNFSSYKWNHRFS